MEYDEGEEIILSGGTKNNIKDNNIEDIFIESNNFSPVFSILDDDITGAAFSENNDDLISIQSEDIYSGNYNPITEDINIAPSDDDIDSEKGGNAPIKNKTSELTHTDNIILEKLHLDNFLETQKVDISELIQKIYNYYNIIDITNRKDYPLNLAY